MEELIDRLSDWAILRPPLGRGSYGTVYEIRHRKHPNARAALKVISFPQAESDITSLRDNGLSDQDITELYRSQADEFSKEFLLMQRLKGHPNVVQCEDHQVIAHENDPGWDILLRMELLASLPNYYKSNFPDKPVDDATVIRLGIDICRALQTCEQHGIIHRDIKPQNIFIGPDGTFKLGDFGVARNLDHTTMATKTGTYPFMAPEIYRVQKYNASVDQYSLGLVLYWLLNERRNPFMPIAEKRTAASEQRALAQRMSGVPLPAPQHGSEQLKQIVLKACAFEPKNRFSSIDQMLQALEALSPGDWNPGYIPLGVRRTSSGSSTVSENTVGKDATMGIFTHDKSKDSILRTKPEKKKKLPTIALVAIICFAAALLLGVGLAVWKPWQDTPTTTISGGSQTPPNKTPNGGGTATSESDEQIDGNDTAPPESDRQIDGDGTSTTPNNETINGGELPTSEETPVTDGNNGGNETPTGPIDTVNVEPGTLTLYSGQTAQLTVASNTTVSWSSSDTEVVRVSSDGALTAGTPGTATITATAGTATDTCMITVSQDAATAVSIATMPKVTTYYVGDTLNTAGLTLSVTYKSGVSHSVSSGFETSCNMNSAGQKTVTVTYMGLRTSYNITISERPKAEYEIKVRSSNSQYGSVSGGGSSKEGSTVTITAEPKSGCQFVQWDDGSTQRSRTITVTENETYTAQFLGPLSDWVTDVPYGAEVVDQTTRYRGYETVTTDSATPPDSSYTLVKTDSVPSHTEQTDYVKKWPSGFSKSSNLYTKYSTVPTANSGDQVSESLCGYIYWHWCRGYQNGPLNRLISDCKTSKYPHFHAYFDTSAPGSFGSKAPDGKPNPVEPGVYYRDNSGLCRDSYWYMVVEVYRMTRQVCTTEYTYQRLTDWQDTRPSGQYESREFYRYRPT